MHPRILVSGFGLFHEKGGNISGSLVRNLGDLEVVPAQISISNFGNELLREPRPDILQDAEAPVRVRQRQMQWNAQTAECCFVELEVRWASSVLGLCQAINDFRPEIVLMLGQTSGDSILESAALPVANELAGFFASGGVDKQSLAPAEFRNEALLTRFPAEVFPWSVPDLAEEILQNCGEELKRLGLSLQGATGARRSNTYICNFLAYHLARWLREPAGWRCPWLPELPVRRPEVGPVQFGFFHIQAQEQWQAAAVKLWMRVVVVVLHSLLAKQRSENSQ